MKTQIMKAAETAPMFFEAEKFVLKIPHLFDIGLMIIKNGKEQTGVTLADVAQTFVHNAARHHELNAVFSGTDLYNETFGDNVRLRETLGFVKRTRTANKHNSKRSGALWGLDVKKFADAYNAYSMWFSVRQNKKHGAFKSKASVLAWLSAAKRIAATNLDFLG